MRQSSVSVAPPTSITSTTATASYGSFDNPDPTSESSSRTTNAIANHSRPSSSSSLQRAALLYALDDTLVNNLSSNNIHSFFPVQEMIFPLLFGMQEGECVFKRDICVSAPTGSGKTLSYAIPIINSLLRDRRGSTNKVVASSAKTSSTAVDATTTATNFVSGLEALVVLPTRELANQVNNVFCRLLVGSSIKILCCTGNTSIKEEQSLLFGYYEHNQVSSLSAFGGGGGGGA
jgi:superfamily II DNA/RNA helicase